MQWSAEKEKRHVRYSGDFVMGFVGSGVLTGFRLDVMNLARLSETRRRPVATVQQGA
jgi:hypothetical protein